MDSQKNVTASKAWYQKWWVWVIAGMVIFGTIGGVVNNANQSDGNESPRQNLSSPGTSVNESVSTPFPSLNSIKYIEVMASDLYDEYNTNEIAADNNYKGKWLSVSGTVQSIGKDILDAPYIVLADSQFGFGVQCYISKGSLETASELTSGDTVIIMGKCDGKIIHVMLKDCTIK